MLHSLGTCIGRSSAASMRHATGEQPWIRPGRAADKPACVPRIAPPAGEEAVTKESFVSICWRLIPYWLNNWEQQWGAECSSMLFELPHFAIELLVVLPSVQVGRHLPVCVAACVYLPC